MMRSILTVLSVVAALAAAPVHAQSKAESLADMRAELATLADSLQALRAELVAGGGGGLASAGGGSALQRMDAMEAQLVQLTSQTEALQNRIDRVVSDGTNRIGDLEFRLCELEDGCDVANLPITARLGGGDAAAPAALPATGAPAPVPSQQPELAVGEQADFDRAKAALDSGDFRGAADQFAAFGQAYPGGPLTSEAQFLRGEALSKAGETASAARAYLDAFSGAPDGAYAAVSLVRLGAALGILGQQQDACLTLGEVSVRFPASPEVGEAASAMQALGCQ